MPNYVLAYYGAPNFETPEAGQAHQVKWTAWIEGLGDAVVEPAIPLEAAQTVSTTAVTASGRADRLTGFTIVRADDMEAAVAMAQGCPHLEHGTLDVAKVFEM